MNTEYPIPLNNDTSTRRELLEKNKGKEVNKKRNAIIMTAIGLILAISSFLVWFSLEISYGFYEPEFNPLTTIARWMVIIGIIIFIVGLVTYIRAQKKKP